MDLHMNLKVARELELMHGRGQAVRHHGHHSGVQVRVRQPFLLQQHAQHLLQRLSPAERQLQRLLAVEVAGRGGGVLGARLCHSLVSPEVVPIAHQVREQWE